MKVVVDGKLYDSEKEPITIIWDTDEERIASGNHISCMNERGGPRMYLHYPNGMNGERIHRDALNLYKKHKT